LFSFGVIADIQYADKKIKGRRDYRVSIPRLQKCVNDLNQRDLAFTIQLGDIIDGNETREQTLADLDAVFEEFDKLTMPKYHVVGNHCIKAGKATLAKKLQLKSFYYDFTVPEAKGWRFVVLDGNDAGSGVLGKKQLAWFKEKLAKSRAANEKVIVFNHFALLKKAAKSYRMKKPKPVLKAIENSGCVVAYFAGHDHNGGYTCKDGLHHVTLKAMLTQLPNAYAIIDVYPDKLEEIGYGKEPSRELKFKPVSSSKETPKKKSVR
jgi:hypothetical protein